ncbi:6-phosphogluconolactonase [Microbacterium amylolyticum]|uniref:6-phosphogluconolactonase n=1 Tax=Microbacterium amylolyticum TaxID=936337 RepID=A0ABS4ZKM7_9MICO|nr:6-phosphogluconolactonase [Microbacterium amylolyticum]MBP2437848.1 6-phosphogluconolactonase [Microbacterium amylolyticum]
MSSLENVVVRADKSALAHAVAERLISELAVLTAGDGVAHVSLTGGSMGIGTLAAVRDLPDRDDVAWSRVHFWWSDERFVPRNDGERNARQAREALLDALDVPDVNVHEPWASEDGSLDDAAKAYADELSAHGPDGEPAPAFDICLLGVGPDAHIASLFPGREEIHVSGGVAVLPVRNSPKPPPERITFTLPVINRSARVWLVVAGADKAEAVARVRAGALAGEAPASAARGTLETVLFADKAALAD